MKCLEKDRTRRYETANGLARDIQRHLDNEPVVARPPSAAYRFQKLVRRNKLAFAAGGCRRGGAGARRGRQHLAGGARDEGRASGASCEQAERALSEQARADRDRAVRAEADARVQAAVAKDAGPPPAATPTPPKSTSRFQALAENNLGRARELLDRQRPKAGEEDLRGFEWRYLWQLCQGDELATFRDDGATARLFLRTASCSPTPAAKSSCARRPRGKSSPRCPARPRLCPSRQTQTPGQRPRSGVKLWDTETWQECGRCRTRCTRRCSPRTAAGW